MLLSGRFLQKIVYLVYMYTEVLVRIPHGSVASVQSHLTRIVFTDGRWISPGTLLSATKTGWHKIAVLNEALNICQSINQSPINQSININGMPIRLHSPLNNVNNFELFSWSCFYLVFTEKITRPSINKINKTFPNNKNHTKLVSQI